MGGSASGLELGAEMGEEVVAAAAANVKIRSVVSAGGWGDEMAPKWEEVEEEEEEEAATWRMVSVSRPAAEKGRWVF